MSPGSKTSKKSELQMSLIPMSGQEDFHAKTSQWREWARELGLKGSDQACFLNLLAYLENVAPEFSSSRTFRAFSLPMGAETSKSLFERWPASGMVWDGVCLTAGTLESPSHVRGSTLSAAIETDEVQDKYFLSQNAARGILRRADRMGRSLFPPLRKALEILSKGPSLPDSRTASTRVPRGTQVRTGVGTTSRTRKGKSGG
jgi:hypothetical protein